MKTRQNRILDELNDPNHAVSCGTEVTADSYYNRLLPDEIVKEILCQSGLIISDEDFRCTDWKRSPFFSPTHTSTSALLLISKQWLRVATPLLYHTVVLRSKAQMEALEFALRRKNKVLGSYIKWMRLEGHYGALMKKIFDAAPNITDLCFTLSLLQSESPSGLVKSLPNLKPTTVILYEDQHSFNMRRPGTRLTELLEAVHECLAGRWTSLECCYLGRSLFLAPRKPLVVSLARTPNLRKVYVHGIRLDRTTLHLVQTLTQSQSLKEIHCQELDHEWSPGPRIESLVRIRGKTWNESKEEIQLQALQNALPRSARSDLLLSQFDDHIWRRIIDSFFDVALEDVMSIRETPQALHFWVTDRVSLLLTCKTFLKLGRRHLYRFAILHGNRQLKMLAEHLQRNPDFIQYIEHLVFPPLISHTAGTPDNAAWEVTEAMHELFERLHLTTLGMDRSYTAAMSLNHNFYSKPPRLPWELFEILCQNSSSSLTSLHALHFLRQPTTPISFLSPFKHLQNLRSVVLACSNLNILDMSDLSPIPSTMFPALEYLDYREDTEGEGRSVLAIMSHMNLPSLRRVRIRNISKINDAHVSAVELFLATHGPKIIDLHILNIDGMVSPFKSCPNLIFLGIDLQQPDPATQVQEFFTCVPDHISLKKIEMGDGYWPRIMFEPPLYSSFPSLQEIKVLFDYDWPSTERDIKDSFWPGRAEALRTADILLTNIDGKHWNPRLKARKVQKRR